MPEKLRGSVECLLHHCKLEGSVETDKCVLNACCSTVACTVYVWQCRDRQVCVCGEGGVPVVALWHVLLTVWMSVQRQT